MPSVTTIYPHGTIIIDHVPYVPYDPALEPMRVRKKMIVPHPLLEVFSVRIDKLKDGRTEIHGSVIVNDAYGPVALWTRPKENPLRMRPGENRLLLEGPSRHMTSSDPLHIDLDIHCQCPIDDAEGLESSSGSQIANECIIYDPFVKNWHPGIKHDKVTQRFEGEEGVVTLEYLILRDGFYAEIEVVVMLDGRHDSDGVVAESDAVRRVCGNITTDNGHGECELFRKVKSSSQYATVVHSGSNSDSSSSPIPLPLSRSVVATPRGGSLRVKAFLQDYDHDHDQVSSPVVMGVVEFAEPCYKKSETKIIEGCGGKIAVKVLWKYWW